MAFALAIRRQPLPRTRVEARHTVGLRKHRAMKMPHTGERRTVINRAFAVQRHNTVPQRIRLPTRRVNKL